MALRENLNRFIYNLLQLVKIVDNFIKICKKCRSGSEAVKGCKEAAA